MAYLKKTQGFTLVQLVIGMMILVIMMAAIAPLFSTILMSTSSGLVKNNLLQEGRWAVDIMAKELSGIDGVNKITSPVIGASASTISFILFNDTTNTPITYSIVKNGVNSEVQRQVGTTGIKRRLTDVERAGVVGNNDLVFTRNSDGTTVDISLKVTQISNNHTYTEILKTSVTPLNNGRDI